VKHGRQISYWETFITYKKNKYQRRQAHSSSIRDKLSNDNFTNMPRLWFKWFPNYNESFILLCVEPLGSLHLIPLLALCKAKVLSYVRHANGLCITFINDPTE
jgi:hypothetical protein